MRVPARSLNRNLAAETVRWALAHGVREVVVCAGARNLPLVAAWHAAPGVRLWHHPEERSAAFFALGRLQAGSGPVAVTVTSGTAVAELLPATIEAHYQGLPLLLLTADRPRHFRGTAAPQTIRQPGLFTCYAEFVADLAEPGRLNRRRWKRQGPAHVNICFHEPLEINEQAIDITHNTETRAAILPPRISWNGFGQHGRLVVVVGKLEPAEREAVAGFLRRLRAPVWVEGASGLWGHPALDGLWVRDGAALLAARPTHLLRLGGVPCDRFWRDLESASRIRVCSVSRLGCAGLGRPSESLRADLAALDRWHPRDDPARRRWSDRLLARHAGPVERPKPGPREPMTEGGLFRHLSASLPDGATVFLGNSLPVRLWQAHARWRPGLRLFANRGANGIDGEISSFLGLAHGADEAWGIFGDLTTLYDLAAPWILPQMEARRLRLLVIHNGGGGIFARLPALANASPGLRDLVCNPHDISFLPWARLWSMPHRLVRSPADFHRLPDRPVVLEFHPAP